MKSPKERARMFELISGSQELAEEYDKKKELLQRAKEETQFHFNKKRTATAEKKQISLEKVEVNYRGRGGVALAWLLSLSLLMSYMMVFYLLDILQL